MGELKEYSEYNKIRQNNVSAKKVLGYIGKQQRTTAKAVGKIHSLKCKVDIHYQEHDGGKNYHQSDRLNEALSTAAREMWGALQARAKSIMKDEESAALIASELEINAISDKIAAAKIA